MSDHKIAPCPACGSPAVMDMANECEAFATKGLSSFTVNVGPFSIGVVDSTRWQAAERLARLVLGNFSDLAGAMVMTSWDGASVRVDGMVAEARRVLGGAE